VSSRLYDMQLTFSTREMLSLHTLHCMDVSVHTAAFALFTCWADSVECIGQGQHSS
jgi:hypothetical protein